MKHTKFHTDGKYPITRMVRDPRDPDLIEMERNEDTGRTTLVYETGKRTCGDVESTPGGSTVIAHRFEDRPSSLSHDGWKDRAR